MLDDLRDDLTDDESALVDAARAGRVLTPAAPVRAELVRELLLGRHGELDPRGVRLHEARVVGPLELDYVTTTAGLDLVDCDLEEPLDVSNAVLPRLVLSGSRLTGIRGTSLRITGDARLDGIVVTGSGDPGAVRLLGARVGGLLTLVRAEVRNDSGPALYADGLQVGGTLFLRDARLFGHSHRGAVRLPGAHVGGELNMEGIEVHNSTGAAVDGPELTVANNVLIRRAVLHGHGEAGAIRLRGARIGGVLSMADAEITNDAGPAVLANRLRAEGHLSFSGAELSGTGAGGHGALSVVNARLSNDFYLGDVRVRNDSGPAVFADGVQVDGTLIVLRARLCGAGEDGAVWLVGAQVRGLRLAESEVRNESGPALFADRLQVREFARLQEMRLSGTGHATVRLAGASAGGQFSLLDTTIEHPEGVLLDVNDFSYAALAGVDWRRWLDLIRFHTRAYRPSPYQQLAAVERAAGHDGNARDILISQQHDLRRRAPHALGGPLTRSFHRLWGAVAGYGYRARRTALALLLALMAASGVSLWAGHVTTGPGRHAAEHTITTAAPGTPCSTVELVGLGLDRGLPLGPTGLRSRCDLDTESTAGQAFTVLLWIVQAAIWGLATLALAGYTGLIRKIA
ncbi:hypothetical protein [Actinophytocola sp.]|uniref:hypothetical protein n=1 Tax=Actinophytocola sp. TaxID=1872138 RepID=UPI0038999DD5